MEYTQEQVEANRRTAINALRTADPDVKTKFTLCREMAEGGYRWCAYGWIGNALGVTKETMLHRGFDSVLSPTDPYGEITAALGWSSPMSQRYVLNRGDAGDSWNKIADSLEKVWFGDE